MTTPITYFADKYEFLSNFSPVWGGLIYEGLTYPTVEHAFQAAKTNNHVDKLRIRDAGEPGIAKYLGQSVELRPDWDAVKISVMRRLLYIKFAGSNSLLKDLAETGDAELIEGNYWGDTYWGVCRDVGTNNLGKLLMEVRSVLCDRRTSFV